MISLKLACSFVSLFIVVIRIINEASRTRLVRVGKATYYVRFSASGPGKVCPSAAV